MQVAIKIVDPGSGRDKVLNVVFADDVGALQSVIVLTVQQAREIATGMLDTARQAESRIITPAPGLN